MSLYKGNTQLTVLFESGNSISQVYKGNNLIYQELIEGLPVFGFNKGNSKMYLIGEYSLNGFVGEAAEITAKAVNFGVRFEGDSLTNYYFPVDGKVNTQTLFDYTLDIYPYNNSNSMYCMTYYNCIEIGNWCMIDRRTNGMFSHPTELTDSTLKIRTKQGTGSTYTYTRNSSIDGIWTVNGIVR